jgi:xylono-1,5-lactonase
MMRARQQHHNMRNAELLLDITSEHGEGPVWDDQTGALYWVDLLKGDYHVFHIGSGEHHCFNAGQPLGVLALREKGGMIMALRDGFAWVDKKGDLPMLIHSPEPGAGTRFNDGAVDPAGRFFAGTMTFDGKENRGNLYSLDSNHQLRHLEHALFIPNGMGWSLDGNTFFLTDTNANLIYAYDYDVGSGSISNKRKFIEFSPHEFPDGFAMDSEGGFWIAMWGGGALHRYDRGGRKMAAFDLPVQYPTSCCFGGKDMSTLFITSSRLMLSQDEREEHTIAGKMLRLDTDVAGLPQRRFKG